MSVKINALELENVKRIKAVALEPSPDGLTVIGGKNGQGKTSVLDAIAWALGGNKYKPSGAQRDGSLVPPHLKVTLSNGVTVERKGKNGDLKVTDPAGQLAGQALLDSFVSSFALDLPKFLNASDKDKADTLLRTIGVEAELYELDRQEKALYSERTQVGRIAEQKMKHAEAMVYHSDVPDKQLSLSELIRQQHEAMDHNQHRMDLERKAQTAITEGARVRKQIDATLEALARLKQEAAEFDQTLQNARKELAETESIPLVPIAKQIEDVEIINRKVAENDAKAAAQDEAEHYAATYQQLTAHIEDVRKERRDLLEGAELPLPGLSVEDGALTYNGQQWDCMSGSEQLKVATAIVRKLNPECGFVLLDKLEQMDTDTLSEFGAWLESEGLQAIATRVSTGSECTVIITDGRAEEKPQPAAVEFKGWT